MKFLFCLEATTHLSLVNGATLLVAVECLQSETQVKNKTIVKLLRGGSNSSAKVLQGLGEIVNCYKAVGDGYRGRFVGSKTREIRCGPYWLTYLCEQSFGFVVIVYVLSCLH